VDQGVNQVVETRPSLAQRLSKAESAVEVLAHKVDRLEEALILVLGQDWAGLTEKSAFPGDSLFDRGSVGGEIRTKTSRVF
jgi:hypothetical protein